MKTTHDNEAIHAWFGLTYSNYLVLPRTLMQSMPAEWQARMVRCLREIDQAFAHIPTAEAYNVQAAKEKEVCSLTPREMQLTDVELSPIEDLDGYPQYYHEGVLAPHDFRVLVPCEDPVPPYNRGRTHIAPALPILEGEHRRTGGGLLLVPHRGAAADGALLGTYNLDEGYQFYHVHQVDHAVPPKGAWAVCFERDDPNPIGVGQRDQGIASGRQDNNPYAWYEGEALNYMYVGRRITASSDPTLIATGIPVLDSDQVRMALAHSSFLLRPEQPRPDA